MITNSLLKAPEEVFHNCKTKTYRNGMQKITVSSRKVYKDKGLELSDCCISDNEKENEKVKKPQCLSNETRSDSIRRAINKIFDIAMQTDFKYFVTLTFDKQYADRYSPKETSKLIHRFLDNLTKNNGLTYLLVPEFHKNGAVHAHCLINDSVALSDSGTMKPPSGGKPLKIETLKRKGIDLSTCQKVFNIPQWKYGFSTAIELYGDTLHTAKYITKYITKDTKKIFGNFYYAGGKSLVRDVPTTLSDIDYDTFEADSTYFCEPINTFFKFKEQHVPSDNKTAVTAAEPEGAGKIYRSSIEFSDRTYTIGIGEAPLPCGTLEANSFFSPHGTLLQATTPGGFPLTSPVPVRAEKSMEESVKFSCGGTYANIPQKNNNAFFNDYQNFEDYIL